MNLALSGVGLAPKYAQKRKTMLYNDNMESLDLRIKRPIIAGG